MRKLIDRLLRRQPTDPLAGLREPIPDEDYWRLKRERQEQDMLDALREGEQIVPDYMNVAAGRGLSLHYLRDMGLMTISIVDASHVRFTPTSRAADYLREHS